MHGKIILSMFPKLIAILHSHTLCVWEGKAPNVSPVNHGGNKPMIPANVSFGSCFLLSDFETYRHTFSEAFGRPKNWVNLLAGCKIDLWKTEGTKGKICYILILRKHALLSFPLQDDMSPKGRLWMFPQSWHGAGSHRHYWIKHRSKRLLKCSCCTSLIDLNNLLNEFIYIFLVMIYHVLAIILLKWVQIKLNNCASLRAAVSLQLRESLLVLF